MRVRVLAVNADGAQRRALESDAAVVTTSAAPQNTARPSITGERPVGEELTAEDGTWTNTPTTYAYQWQRCDIDATELPAGRRCDREDLRRPERRSRLPAPRRVTARNASGSGSATLAVTRSSSPTSGR